MSDYEFSTENTVNEDYIPLGLPSVSLMLSNNLVNGFRKGSIVRLCGMPGSGKSFLSTHVLSQCAKDKRCANMNLIYMDKENGMTLDLESLYGAEIAKRIQYMAPDKLPVSIEGIHKLIRDKCKEKPSVIVLDSIDTLLSEKEIKFRKEADELREQGKEVSDPAMMLSARVSSNEFRETNDVIASTGSVLLLISQLRSSPQPYISQFNMSGGKAITFYASTILGLKKGDNIVRKDRYGKERIVGSKVEVQCLKNRQTGVVKDVHIANLYYRIGFVPEEDVVDFLLNRTEAITNTRGILKAEWLLNKDTGIRRNDLIKLLMSDKEVAYKATARMQEEWDLIESDFKNLFD